MIERLQAENFKCLRNVDVTFTPLTVLIGPNDGGKSTILDAIVAMNRFYFGNSTPEPVGGLSSTARTEIPPQRPTRSYFTGSWAPRVLSWRRDETLTVKLALTTEGALVRCTATMTPELTFRMGIGESEPLVYEADEWIIPGVERVQRKRVDETQFPNNDPPSPPQDPPPGTRTHLLQLKELNARAQAFRASERYQLTPRELRKESSPAPNAVLSGTGDNLVTVLDALLTGPDRDAVRDLENVLHDAIRSLLGISTRATPSGSGAKTIEFILASDGGKPVTIPCAHVSDGAMLLTAFLALAYSDTPGILLIEEPENGLHPERLRDVVALLRKITTGQIGNRPRQVILTTHSPILLNFVEPEEVRIVRRGPDGGTQVTEMTQVPDIRNLLKEFAVGELWYLLGENALIEGKKP